MRLDKYISHALNKTRNEARQIIKAKKIKVNGRIALKNDLYIDCYMDHIEYNDQLIAYDEFIYLMMNKPQGYISATVDKLHKTVIDLVKDEYPNYDLFPIGRLDIDTEGLLLITNNGRLSHNITSPRNDHIKKYYVEVDSDFQKKDIDIFNQGMIIMDGSNNEYRTKPAVLEIIGSNKAYISITEGKYHQIKRMCLQIGKKVTYLKRVQMKGIILDEHLKLGEYRKLNSREMEQLLMDEKL